MSSSTVRPLDSRMWVPFLVLVGVVALAKLLISGPVGSRSTWATILGLWGLGAVWAGVAQARVASAASGQLLGTLALQNLVIQLVVALPALVAGVWRLAGAGELDVVFWANALLTLVAVPALSAVVLSFFGMIIAVPVFRLTRTCR